MTIGDLTLGKAKRPSEQIRHARISESDLDFTHKPSAKSQPQTHTHRFDPNPKPDDARSMLEITWWPSTASRW